jgi:hypothetical protein
MVIDPELAAHQRLGHVPEPADEFFAHLDGR